MRAAIREFDELIVRVDESGAKITTFRPYKTRDELVLLTEYPLDRLKQMSFDEAALVLGQDILAALDSTRDLWKP